MLKERSVNTYLALFFVILLTGILFHQDRAFPGSALGHSLGILGSIFMLMALIYPFRKRILKKKGRQNPLGRHISYGLIGASLVVIHSAHVVSSLIGILIFLSVVLVILSGSTGYFFFKKVNRSLNEQKRDYDLLKQHIKKQRQKLMAACRIDDSSDISSLRPRVLTSPWAEKDDCERWLEELQILAEKEYSIRFFDRLKIVFSTWHNIHFVFAVLLFALLVVHVLTTIYYGLRWLS